MKKEKKMTKKASVKVWKIASKFQPSISKNITFDEAWEIIAKEGNLEGAIETNRNRVTVFKLYKNDDVIDTYNFPDSFKEGDWDWNTIYKTVLEDVISRRLYKTKKSNKQQIQKPIKSQESKEDLKRLKFNLKMKIKHWANKGKDVSELIKELQELESKLKSFK